MLWTNYIVYLNKILKWKLFKNHNLVKFLENSKNTGKVTWEIINAERNSCNVLFEMKIILKENGKRICHPIENIKFLNEYFINRKNILGDQHKCFSSSQPKERSNTTKNCL